MKINCTHPTILCYQLTGKDKKSFKKRIDAFTDNNIIKTESDLDSVVDCTNVVNFVTPTSLRAVKKQSLTVTNDASTEMGSSSLHKKLVSIGTDTSAALPDKT